MRKIIFDQLTTSSLGFGCSTLTKQFSKSKAIKTLDIAFDCGITHFDTARAYGFGMAESLLGIFSRNKRNKITITTKFGLESKKVFTNNLFLINTARLAINTVGGLKKNVVSHTSGINKREIISAENAEKSLHQSLRELKTDYIDFFLLHECLLTEANNEALIKFFERSVADGKIRHVGLAGADTRNLNNHNLPPIYNVLQYHNEEKFEKTHSFYTGVSQLHIHYNILSQKSGKDNKSVAELLKSSAANNKNGICLFTSTNENHIRSNVSAWNEFKIN